MSNTNPNDNERFYDTADAHKDDELSTEEMDRVAGGVRVAGPEDAGKRGRSSGAPEDAGRIGRSSGAPEDAGDKGLRSI